MERNKPLALPSEIVQKLEALRSFVVLDVETTGFDRSQNHIIEIGMIKVSDGKEIAQFSSFINPGIPIPSHISALTGITDADVQDAPSFSEIAKDIFDFMEDSIIVGHNVPFDIGFMVCEFARCGIHRDCNHVDTLFLARKAYPKLKSHKLSNLIAHLGFKEAQDHRALDDARWTLKLLQAIQKQFAAPSLDDVIHSSNKRNLNSFCKTKQFESFNLDER